MSRELPILFNENMVRAILDGRKTVTRRLLKPPFEVHPNGYITKPRGNERLCPYESPYQPGDIMYVRETWSEWTDGYLYKAWTSPFPQPGKSSVMKWHPSIHMPKEAARIWLKVKDVRVERLQEITWQQAAKEGCQGSTSDEPDPLFHLPTLRGEFQKLWNSTIKKSDIDTYGWDANPWVWVIEFERCEKPENF